MKKYILLIFVFVFIALVSSAEIQVPESTNSTRRIFNMRSTIIAVTTFLGLTDTPSAYTGSSGLCVLVNSGETDLEFGACNSSGGFGRETFFELQNDYITNSTSNGINVTDGYFTGNINVQTIFAINWSNVTLRQISEVDGPTFFGNGTIKWNNHTQEAFVDFEDSTMKANSTNTPYISDQAVVYNVSITGLSANKIIDIDACGYLTDPLGGATVAAWDINIKNKSGVIIGSTGVVSSAIIVDLNLYKFGWCVTATDPNADPNANYYLELDEINDGMQLNVQEMQVKIHIR